MPAVRYKPGGRRGSRLRVDLSYVTRERAEWMSTTVEEDPEDVEAAIRDIVSGRLKVDGYTMSHWYPEAEVYNLEEGQYGPPKA